MTAIDRRLSKLEQGQQPAVHRPPNMPTDEFFGLMFAAFRGIPEGASADSYRQAAGPWVAAMTPDECHELVAAIESLMDDQSVESSGSST
jgi:hypothetical protein